jgi:hypothetical protein
LAAEALENKVAIDRTKLTRLPARPGSLCARLVWFPTVPPASFAYPPDNHATKPTLQVSFPATHAIRGAIADGHQDFLVANYVSLIRRSPSSESAVHFSAYASAALGILSSQMSASVRRTAGWNSVFLPIDHSLHAGLWETSRRWNRYNIHSMKMRAQWPGPAPYPAAGNDTRCGGIPGSARP